MRPHSLVFRLALLQQALAAAIIVGFAASAFWLSTRTLEQQEVIFLSSAAEHAAQSLDREWREEGDLPRAAASAIQEDASPGVRIDVLDPAGRLVASTATTAARAAHDGMREVRRQVPRGAWVVTSMSTRPRGHALSALVTALALTALPLFVLVTLVSRALARRALRPLSRMAGQAEQVSFRDDVRPLATASDPAEIASLAGAFNRLLARLGEMLRAERRFTRDAAHELRTPLTVLSGELEYALSDASLPERHRERLRRAWDQVRGMSELVEALLLLRRTDEEPPDRERFEPVNLGDLVRDVARELGGRLPARAPDLRLAAADEVLVAGHPALLTSALRNLLSNAFKFSAAGDPVRVSVAAEGPHRVVVVEDGGPGIAAEDFERVFDPFFRGPEARANHDGYGLGLPILRRVARIHGGDVVVSASTLGGARFELRLPAWASH